MRALLAGAVLSLGLATPALALETFCDGHEELLERYLEMSEVLFNGERQSDRAGEYYAEAFRSPDSDDGEGIGLPGPERMQRSIENSKRAFPERELINEVIVCTDDFVIARTRIVGTMTGPMGPYRPTGKSFEFKAIDIYRFNDQGKVFERWGSADSAGLLMQLGLMQEVPGVRGGAAEAEAEVAE